MNLGANYLEDGRCEFLVWAPQADRMELKISGPPDQLLPMQRRERGYWRAVVEEVTPGTRYRYRIDGEKERPDPASYDQPEGVHGPSQIVDHRRFAWEDGKWHGMALSEMVIYEVHVGTFTPQGTFDAVIPRLKELHELGITAIEIMPVASFPGERGWGYDGTYPFAVQNSYGGPEGLKRLIQACHREGMAVVLDVVYNHLGPEGNYLWDYGPYFTDRYRTPWGEAVNFDGAYSDEVRRYFTQNALHWFKNYHVDALRLDAVHAIYDFSAKPFLQELAEQVHEFSLGNSRNCLLIAESALNNARIIRPPEIGGYGLDAQWSDDFHHALHTLLTGEDLEYYIDYGHTGDLVKAYREGFVYDGRYSHYQRRRFGASSADRPGHQFVVSSQNHDQVGNRMLGDRLITLAGFEGAKVAAAATILSPFVPLLFMGEEYAEEAPFPYFVHLGDPDLVAAVREGRREEFSSFHHTGEPPDPQSETTRESAVLNWEDRHEGRHRAMRDFYRELLRLRRAHSVFSRQEKENMEGFGLESQKLIWLRRWQGAREVLCLLNFSEKVAECAFPGRRGPWRKLLDSSEGQWYGPGSELPDRVEGKCRLKMAPRSCVYYDLE